MQIIARLDDQRARHGDAGGLHEPLGAILVERDGQGERIGAGVRNAEHLQHGGHAGLARPADALTLGEVEHEIGCVGQQSCKQLPAVAQLHDLMAQRLQHRGDGLDGGGAVEFFLEIVGDVSGKGGVAFQIEGDADPHP